MTSMDSSQVQMCKGCHSEYSPFPNPILVVDVMQSRILYPTVDHTNGGGFFHDGTFNPLKVGDCNVWHDSCYRRGPMMAVHHLSRIAYTSHVTNLSYVTNYTITSSQIDTLLLIPHILHNRHTYRLNTVWRNSSGICALFIVMFR